MLSILCMHFFNAYQTRITLRNSGAIDVKQRFLVSESNFCWYHLKNILSYGSWKEDVTWNKKSHIKMFKAALFDCAINEKCCSVDGGRGIFPLFSPPRGIWQLKSPHHHREFAQSKAQKNANARGSARMGGGGGGRWAQLELTDALSSLMHSITVLCKTLSFCPLVILCFSEGFSPTEWVSSYSLEIEVRSSNNDNACLISSFFSLLIERFYFFAIFSTIPPTNFQKKEMFSLSCVQILFPRFLVRILIGRSPFCQTSTLMLSSSISS